MSDEFDDTFEVDPTPIHGTPIVGPRRAEVRPGSHVVPPESRDDDPYRVQDLTIDQTIHAAERLIRTCPPGCATSDATWPVLKGWLKEAESQLIARCDDPVIYRKLQHVRKLLWGKLA